MKQQAIREQYCRQHGISNDDLEHMLQTWEQEKRVTRLTDVNTCENRVYRVYGESATPDEALTREQWTEIKALYNHECLRCKRREPDIELVADHVLPKSKGGATTAANTQPLCRSCNATKHNKHIDYRVDR